jgi:hypothetical protein
MIAFLLRRDPEAGASTERMTSSYLEGDFETARALLIRQIPRP